ncbi:hypothetical protein CRM22_002375, partial [Opisthorchis felineus]
MTQTKHRSWFRQHADRETHFLELEILYFCRKSVQNVSKMTKMTPTFTKKKPATSSVPIVN